MDDKIDFQEIDFQPEIDFQEGSPDNIYSRKFIPQLTKGLYESVPFGKRVVSMLPNAAQLMRTQEEVGKPVGAKAQIGRAVGQVAPDFAMMAPFMRGARAIPFMRGAIGNISKGSIGVGGYSGAKALLPKPEDTLNATLEGMVSGALFGGASQLGANIIPKVLPFAERIGSAAGGGAIAAGLAPEGEKLSQGLLMGGMGGMFPAKRMSKPSATYAKEATSTYRDILRPTQGEVKNIEIRKGTNIDDYYTLAAEEGLPIKTTPDKKLDTAQARQIISEKINTLDDLLSEKLAATEKTRPYIDLYDIKRLAKAQARRNITNDTEYKAYAKDIDTYINDTIEARSRYVSGAELNEIKRGMYQTGYSAMKPTADKAARIIARSAKSAIEKAYPESDIAGINDKMSRYITLNQLLENAQGRVIKGGRLGRYFAQGVGAAVGAGVGAPIPYVGPIAGAIGGRFIGGKAADIAYSPERLSKKATQKMRKGLFLRNEELSGPPRRLLFKR